MLALSGTGIGRRVAIGKAMVLDRSRQEIPKYEVSQDQVHSEIKRFQSALARTRAELRRIQEEIPDHAPHEANAFIDVHLLMLQDPVIAEQPVRAMEEHSYNAEWALKTQADTLVEFFMNIEDPYLRSRKDDIHQVVNRILEELTMENDPPAASLDGNMAGRVVIADDLTPGNLVTLHHRGITAFVTSLGGPISHTAILARSLGIPAVVGLHHAVQYFTTVIFLQSMAKPGLFWWAWIKPFSQNSSSAKAIKQSVNNNSRPCETNQRSPAMAIRSIYWPISNSRKKPTRSNALAPMAWVCIVPSFYS